MVRGRRGGGVGPAVVPLGPPGTLGASGAPLGVGAGRGGGLRGGPGAAPPSPSPLAGWVAEEPPGPAPSATAATIAIAVATP